MRWWDFNTYKYHHNHQSLHKCHSIDCKTTQVNLRNCLTWSVHQGDHQEHVNLCSVVPHVYLQRVIHVVLLTATGNVVLTTAKVILWCLWCKDGDLSEILQMLASNTFQTMRTSDWRLLWYSFTWLHLVSFRCGARPLSRSLCLSGVLTSLLVVLLRLCQNRNHISELNKRTGSSGRGVVCAIYKNPRH